MTKTNPILKLLILYLIQQPLGLNTAGIRSNFSSIP